MNEPKELKLFIANTEQLLDQYGKEFEEVLIQDGSFYIEKPDPIEKGYRKNRFIATDETLGTISVLDTPSKVWDFDSSNTGFWEEVKKKLVPLMIQSQNEESGDFDKNIFIDGISMNITYQPYIPETTDYIVNELGE